MEGDTNVSKSLPGSASTSKLGFRPLCVILIFMLIIFGYFSTQMNQGRSFYVGGEMDFIFKNTFC